MDQNIKIAVDAVVLGYDKGKLKLLLIKPKFNNPSSLWALPGGFVLNNETLDTAVIRELKEETNVTINYLEQLYTFGNIDRDPRGRVISVAYLALLNPKNFNIKADTDAADVNWYDVEDIPKLAYDHLEIIDKAIERIRTKIKYQPIGFELLNSEFPFSDFENLYQTLLNKKIDRRNFRKKVLSFGFLTETEKIYKPTSGRPAKLFKFDDKKYKQLLKEGIHFDIKFA